MMQHKISELPIEERPSYKIEKHPQVMSQRELLALIIGGEDQMKIAEQCMKSCRGNLRKLGQDSLLEEIEGIGKATSNRIMAAVRLAQRLASQQPEMDRITIHSPEDAADLVQYEMSTLDQEELRVILLNTRNHVLGVKTIYRGSLNSSQVRVGEIFRPAIKHNAAAIIIAHNHPSGSFDPSPDDVCITKAILSAGKLLDIQVLDHLIIGANGFLSLNRRSLGFSDGSETKEKE